MSNIFDLRSPAKRFRFFAVLEAITWLGLLIGMGFKYIPNPQNAGAVAVPGMVHGIVFVLYVIIASLTARKFRWTWKVTVVALLSSIPPFGTIVFEMWAVRHGQLGELSTGGTESSRRVAA